MKTLLFGLLLFSVSLFGSEGLKDSVVQIMTTHKEYDYESPWSPPTVERSSGSGFIIEGKRIITNAHVIEEASFIQVRSATSREWYEASVKFVGHDCDLAIIELDDPSFFEGKKTLEFGEHLLRQQEEVAVHGFPMGGRELSVTKGIVSRVEMGYYAHSGAYLLDAQIDAPINPGNSGGPVIANGKVVGIAHQVLCAGQNIGYMIPIPIIHHFMEEVEKGEYLGFPKNPLKVQSIRNPAMRTFYGLDEGKGGLLVCGIPENHYLSDVLEVGDILFQIDGHEVDSHGWIELSDMDISLPFQYVIMMKHFGDSLDIVLMRNGEVKEVSVVIDFNRRGTSLVQQEFDKPPTYYISGGFVFQPLVENFLYDVEIDPSLWVIDLFYHLFRGKVEQGRDEVVVLSRVLNDVINVGYQYLEKKIIDKVNGKPIKNLKDLIQQIETSTDPYLVIETQDGLEIVLDQEQMKKRSPVILNRYSIPYDRSGDLR
ncbi:MAG: trypsin-like peptidase domain-containing protein [Chlamydiia bacterium]|nr:trypsin-like peptidase domain-containing protein [Chlamydiia bacterium]